MMQDSPALCQVETAQIRDVDRISTLSGDISAHTAHPPQSSPDLEFESKFDRYEASSSRRRGNAPSTVAALERARAKVAAVEEASGLPALSLGPDQAARVRDVVRHINAHPYLARLGGGERLTAHLYVAHAGSDGFATPGLARVGALLGVDAESAGDYLARVSGLGFLRKAARTRRHDGSLSVYRVAVRPITDAAARGAARRMNRAQCAVLARWTVALLSDTDVTMLGPDDRWRLLQIAAEHPDGVFFGEQGVLARLWGLSPSGTRKAVARMRQAGVLTTEQLRDGGGRMGLTRWCIAPIAAAVATARAGFADAQTAVAALSDSLRPDLDRRPVLPNGPFKINYGSDLHKHQIAAGQNRRPALPGLNPPPSTLDGEPSVHKVREDSAETDGPSKHVVQHKPDPAKTEPTRVTEGVRLLGAVCAKLALDDPRWSQVIGPVLWDQGLVVDGLLALGWLPTQIESLLTGRQLPHPAQLTTSVGAVVAGRLRAAALAPTPSMVTPMTSDSDGPTVPAHPERWWQEWAGPRHSSTEAASRSVADATARRTGSECQGDDGLCGRPTNGDLLCYHCNPTRTSPEEQAAAAAAARWAEADRKFRSRGQSANPFSEHWLRDWQLSDYRADITTDWLSDRDITSQASDAERLITGGR
ncbi:hypothetical protein ABTY61_22955 [Kitasatospora sp. NPDC096128]|uniref:hypothetical protein n=1 Tax=Kitasatospora sp. NPDC096128 TaxID=3155547 RepID=UPI00331910A6